jgi:hypothetical protein
VTFVGCTFATGFASTRRDERVEMPLADILGVRLDYHHGRGLLTVRTAQGKVTIGDHIESFQLIAEVLFDAVEVNRASPESYRAALAREPAVRTPWYGWLILVGGIGVVVGGLLWMVVY